MEIIIIIIIVMLVLLLATSLYVIWNLMRKNEQYEAYILEKDKYVNDIKEIISISDKKLQEIDSKGSFEADDEIGWFFKHIKEIQSILNEINESK